MTLRNGVSFLRETVRVLGPYSYRVWYVGEPAPQDGTYSTVVVALFSFLVTHTVHIRIYDLSVALASVSLSRIYVHKRTSPMKNPCYATVSLE